MTGTGTQADPYVVGTWDDLVYVFEHGSLSYAELANDIYAPDEPTNVTSGKNPISSLDGKNHRIIGLTTTSGFAITINTDSGYYYWGNIKNLVFDNCNIQGDGVIRVNSGQRLDLSHVTFNGSFFVSSLISANSAYGINYCGGNIHVNNPSFQLSTYNWNDAINMKFNKWCVDYGLVSPDINNDFLGNQVIANNSKFEVYIPDNGNKLNFNNISYCHIKGNGAGIKITSTSGVNVVENTIPVDVTSTGDNHSLSTSDIKNIQLLYDLGFPASGVVS